MAFKSRLKCLFLKPIFCILFATFLHFARNTTADSMKSVFKKELHKKYANVEFKKKTKNVSVYESKNYKVKVKDLDIDAIGKQTISIEGENKHTSEKHSAEVKVKVQDTTAPEITCEDVLTIEQNEVFDINSHVSLNEEGTIQLTDNINTSDVGTFTTTIKAKDTAGNVSEKYYSSC